MFYRSLNCLFPVKKSFSIRIAEDSSLKSMWICMRGVAFHRIEDIKS